MYVSGNMMIKGEPAGSFSARKRMHHQNMKEKEDSDEEEAELVGGGGRRRRGRQPGTADCRVVLQLTIWRD